MPYIHNLFNAYVLTIQAFCTNKEQRLELRNIVNEFMKDAGFDLGEYCMLIDNWNNKLRLNVVLNYSPYIHQREMKRLCKLLIEHITEKNQNLNFKVMWGSTDVGVGKKDFDEGY